MNFRNLVGMVLITAVMGCGKNAELTGTYTGTQTLTVGGQARNSTITNFQATSQEGRFTATWSNSDGDSGQMTGTVSGNSVTGVTSTYLSQRRGQPNSVGCTSNISGQFDVTSGNTTELRGTFTSLVQGNETQCGTATTQFTLTRRQ